MERLQRFPKPLSLFSCYTKTQRAPSCSVVSERQIFLDRHMGGGAGHRILKHAADVAGAGMFFERRDVAAVDPHFTRIRGQPAGNDIHQRRLSGAVAADDRDKIAGGQR